MRSACLGVIADWGSRITTMLWSAITRRCRHRIGKMTSEDLRVLDPDQNVATCRLRKRIMHSRLTDDQPTESREAAMTFEEWRKVAIDALGAVGRIVDDEQCLHEPSSNLRKSSHHSHAKELIRFLLLLVRQHLVETLERWIH